MEDGSAMERLQSLQRDLIAFSEQRLPAMERLAKELDTSMDALRRLVQKKKKNDESRKLVNTSSSPKPDTLKIEDEEYRVTEEFRQSALQVADELDLDEIESAKLCIEVIQDAGGEADATLPYRALLRFHNQRYVMLECMRLVLLQSVDLEADDQHGPIFQEFVRRIIRGQEGRPEGASAYWKECIDGLTEMEEYVTKIADHKQTAIITGQVIQGDIADALSAQRLLLSRQHEALGSILCYLVRGGHIVSNDFRALLSKAATLDSSINGDITIHYFPALISASVYFGSDDATTINNAKDLHRLFATGPGQLQWKSSNLKSAVTVWWLAEYSSRFSDQTSSETLRVADRQQQEEERTTLCLENIKDKAFHLMLATCQFLKPEVWHDPAKIGLVRFLLEEQTTISADVSVATVEFAHLVMRELQSFSDALVANMPDVIRRLKTEEDDRRRVYFSGPNDGVENFELHLERFIIIMSYAYQDDAEAAQDFWSDKESNLYGFLRWLSQRLPTPRVASFCELLRAIANDGKSGNQVHRFLLEDNTIASGKLRKVYSVGWSQIFSELELYASTIRNKAAVVQQSTTPDNRPPDASLEEPETHIMLEAYLRLASHICRISPDARNWIIREQSFHLGETLIHLASTGHDPRVQSSCFDVLSALLTDKVPEVNDGMWALLESWVSGSVGSSASTIQRPQNLPTRQTPPERQYLQNYVSNAETATALVNLLNALVVPSRHQLEPTNDALPFPENLGAPHRHAGIDAYVDFVLGPVFKSTNPSLSVEDDRVQLDVLRCACLQFIVTCLSTFNEDLVALANTASIGLDAALTTSSLAAYARLHPFARTMDWMFNNNAIAALTRTADQNVDELNTLDPASPKVQATLRSVQVMNLAMKLQATYFDIVRPIVKTQSADRTTPVANSALASYDEVLLSQLTVMAAITSFAASNYTELSLESLNLIRKVCASKKLGEVPNYAEGGRVRLGNRLVGNLAPGADLVAAEIRPCFEIFEWDLETGEEPLKLSKAKAVLDVLNCSLDASAGRPSVAHCLLGFNCHARTVDIAPESAFSKCRSLFHAIAAWAAESPYAVDDSNMSWLLAVKRGCMNVVLKLALSPLTAAIVQPELRSMDFLSAASKNQILAFEIPLWDGKLLQDQALLLDNSAIAVRDFLYLREDYFELAAVELRTASDNEAYSIQERIINAMLGVIRFPNGDQELTNSIFDLFDFFDLETTTASDASCKYLKEIDLSSCIRDDPDTVTAFDVRLAEQLLILRKRELFNSGVVKDAHEEQQVDDEIRAILASLLSQNHWRAIQCARISALEEWTDLLSLVITTGGLEQSNLVSVAHQGLRVILPRFEKALSENLDSAALLAKLTLTLVPAATAISKHAANESTNLTFERLLAAFRVCLKAIIDSGTGLALRDVCYRICCDILNALPITAVNGKSSPSPDVRQLLQLIQLAGDRLITVITEDAFSDRGVTRVSSILFLDALMTLFQTSKTSPTMLRALTKLNFIPVLIDQSIGSVTLSFGGENDELITTVAYFHTALSLLLRICQTPDGTQLVLTSGFFSAVAESRLFSTDPDIGLDIDNPLALKEFYRLLSAVLRVITAVVLARGPSNAAVLQQAREFLRQNKFSMHAVFKRTSAVPKTAGPPEKEARDVAEEFSKLLLVTGFLEDDEPAHLRVTRVNGFT